MLCTTTSQRSRQIMATGQKAPLGYCGELVANVENESSNLEHPMAGYCLSEAPDVLRQCSEVSV
jgi:hypothetical protein